MASDGGRRASFFPKADAALLQSRYNPPVAAERPTSVSPILDPEHANKAIEPWSATVTDAVYPKRIAAWDPSPIPPEPQATASNYLFPVLTRNERLRLTMLFYYTRGALDDVELQSRLQEKVHLARETVGWEFVIAGLLDHNTYTRLVTVGLPLAVLPRRESTCAHKVNQPPGTIFNLPHMVDDWRFRESPHVEHGGLRAYAGAPLCFETEFGDHVAFGSLCVASNTPQEPLSQAQQMSLARLADWIVADIIHSARARRQRERRHMAEMLLSVQKRCDAKDADIEALVLQMLRTVYPDSLVDTQSSENNCIVLEGNDAIPISHFEHGLWEDYDYFEYLLQKLNHQSLVSSKVVRAIVAECEDARIRTFLVVGSKDFHLVFDDVDTWFVQSCAAMLSRGWHNRALKEALKAKEDFLRGITHTLRTPIHGILGSVELLSEELRTRDFSDSSSAYSSQNAASDLESLHQFTYIKNIKSSARELITTVDSIIKLNRWTDTARAERSIELHRIEDLEKELLNEVLLAAPDSPLTMPSIFIHNNLPPDSDSVAIDLHLFIDCIQPLVVNAIQNTSKGIVAVTFSVSEDYSTLTIDVEDTGCGICGSDQTRIFDPYEKVDTHTTGAGLGLTLASRLATLMNGTISLVSSDLDKGSHFRAVFYRPSCACSLKPVQPVQTRLAHLPLSFYNLTSGSEASLSAYLSRLLTTRGFQASDAPARSLLVLDYTAHAEEFEKALSRLPPDQVALCLIAASQTSVPFDIDFETVRREVNVIYVRSPFIASAIELALEEANTFLSEHGNYPDSSPGGTITEAPAPVSNDPGLELSSLQLPRQPPIETSEHFVSVDIVTDMTRQLDIKASAKATPAVTSLPNPTTLLVDDNAINLRLLEMYCMRRNIPSYNATDGQQAVLLYSRRQTSLTLTDECEFSSSNHTPDFIDLILMDL